MATDEYLLARGYLPSTRLNLQFYIWKEAIGYVLHPSIPAIGEHWKVADVATGTGIWITELAKESPASASFDGYDISSEQFPYAGSLPRNITMSELDAMKPPPDHLCGVYDVVHVRLLMGVIDNGDPTPVLRHCLQLLKPGGYLQWDELDQTALSALPRVAGLATPSLDFLANVWRTVKPIEWVSRLPEIFAQHDMGSIAADAHSEKEWQRQMMMEIWCLVADDYAQALEGMGMLDKANGIRKMGSEAYMEIKKGGCYTHTIRVAVGKKSLEVENL